VFSGQTARGNVCFQIANNDAKTLLLYPGYPGGSAQLVQSLRGSSLPKLNKVWFALHRRHLRKSH
jgi:hypothetical protein